MADVKYFADLVALTPTPITDNGKIIAIQSDPKGSAGYKSTLLDYAQFNGDVDLTGLATTAQNIIDAINELVAGSGGMTFEDLTSQLTTPGVTSLTLASTPLDPTKVVLVYNGQEARYGTSPNGDFTISGSTITWNDRDQALASSAQGGEIWARYDLNVAPTALWKRIGVDLTPINTDDNIDMKKGKILFGDGTDTAYQIAQYENASSVKPILQFTPTLAGISNFSGLRFYTEGVSKTSGYHFESKDAGVSTYLSTRNNLFSLSRTIGYLQNGNLSTGTRKAWTEEYDAPTGDYRLFYRNDGTVRTRMRQAFAYDATSYWSSNNTSHPVYGVALNNNDDVATTYDCYYNGTNYISSSTTGNVRLWKKDGGFQIDVANSVAAGGTISFSTALVINTGSGDTSLNSTGALKVSSGTTGERPGTPVNGMIRYNTTTNKFEGYENGAWVNLV